jgi:phage-related protein
MPALPAYVTTHAGDAKQVVPYLVEILVASPWRWTTFGRAIVTLSQTWSPYAVDVRGLTANQYNAASCSLVVADGDDTIASADLALAKGLVGTLVNIWECWLDPSTFSVQATVKKFRGRIEGVSLAMDTATLKCGPWVNFAGKPVPRWTVQANCPYAFKDLRCGYAGADTSCLKTWADCGARTGGSNQVRFGGFRNLPHPNTVLSWTNGKWPLPASPRAGPPPRRGVFR